MSLVTITDCDLCNASTLSSVHSEWVNISIRRYDQHSTPSVKAINVDVHVCNECWTKANYATITAVLDKAHSEDADEREKRIMDYEYHFQKQFEAAAKHAGLNLPCKRGKR